MSLQTSVHPSVVHLVDADARRMKTLLRASFAIAGCLWIVAYTLHFSSGDVMTAFRLDQYQIYLVLLTVWGYQAKREVKRHAVIADLSTKLGLDVGSVTREHLADAGVLGTFDILLSRNRTSRFPVMFTWLLFLAYLLLLAKQMYLLFGPSV